MLAGFVLTILYATLVSGSPTVGRYPRIESETHLDQLVQDINNVTEAQTEVVQTTRNLSSSELQFLVNQLIALRRLRQEEGEAGLEVGQNVGEIISGVLGGGLGNVFQGSSNFIGNNNVQEEVDFVLNNVGPVFDVVLKYGFDGLKQYFGIGTSTTVAPTPQAVLTVIEKVPIAVPIYINSNQTQLSPEQQLQQQQLVLEILQLQEKLQELTEDAEVTTFSSDTFKTEDQDLDVAEGGRDELFANYPLLVQSRVERVH